MVHLPPADRVRVCGAGDRLESRRGPAERLPDIARVRIYVAAFVGLLCAVSGIPSSYAFFQSVDPSLGNGLELQVIAAAVIGGTALSGGRGSVPGALLGALIISVIAGGLTQFGVSINWASFVTGAVIVAAVSIDAVIKRRQAAAAS